MTNTRDSEIHFEIEDLPKLEPSCFELFPDDTAENPVMGSQYMELFPTLVINLLMMIMVTLRRMGMLKRRFLKEMRLLVHNHHQRLL